MKPTKKIIGALLLASTLALLIPAVQAIIHNTYYEDFCVDELDSPKLVKTIEGVISIQTKFNELYGDGPKVRIDHYYSGTHHYSSPLEEGDWSPTYAPNGATVLVYAVYYQNQCRGEFRIEVDRN